MAKRQSNPAQTSFLENTGTTAPAVPAVLAAVREWRKAGYKGATATTQTLLNYWFHSDHKLRDGRPFKYHYAQQEAVESLVYVWEVARARTQADLYTRFIPAEFAAKIRLPEYDAFARYCVKMATGSGKTKVMALAIALVAGLGLFSVLAQTAAILRPIEKLRQDVANRWERDEALSEADYPEEVAPLVADINALLERNRDIVGRARRQAADLAHALKTPSAILRNELTALRENRAKVEKALDALDRLDAQLGRSLARIRMSNTGESTAARTDLSHSIDRFSRLFNTMAARDGKSLATVCDPGLAIRVDAQDIEEVLGNVLDNALKWAARSISLSARRVGDGIEIRVEDDGAGIPEADRAEALRSGGRLDTSKPGTGLGLAIAIDLLRAYGASLDLGSSAGLGGLAVRMTLPARLVVTV